MEKQELIAKVEQILVQDFEVDPSVIKPESRFREELELDSLDAVDLIVRLDKTFGVKADPQRAKALATLGGLYDYIEEMLAPQQA